MSSKRDDTRICDEAGSLQFCGYCGERLPDLGEGQSGSCPSCKRIFGRRKKVRRPAPPPIKPITHDEWLFRQSMQPTIQPVDSYRFKDPVLAALLSAVIPGAGQIYNTQLLKGLLIFCTCWLVIPYFLGIFDAYVTAEKTSRWQAVEAGRQ